MNNLNSTIIVRPFGTRRQAVISYGDTHLVIGSSFARDSVTPAGQATDLLLAALAVDVTFVCQDEAARRGIPLTSVAALTRWSETIKDARLNHAMIRLALTGPNRQQSSDLVEAIKSKSDTYRLLAPVITIEFDVVL